MKNPEKKTFIRFMLIYLSISALLFMMISLYYYYDQAKQIENTFIKEMSSYGTAYRNNGEVKPSKDYLIKVLPKGSLPYPEFLDINGTYISTSCGGFEFPKQIVAVYTKPEAIKSRLNTIKKKITVFMLIAFVLNLFIAFILSWISMQPIRQKNREFQEFVDDVIHDLNAPISAISINLESLQKEACNNKKLLRIGRSIDTIRNLYSNLEVILGNEYKKSTQEVDMKVFAELLVEQLQPLYPTMQFILKVPSVTLTLNPFAFERILVNLIQNASKYSVERPIVTLGIDTKNRFYIRDNGIGMENPEALLSRATQLKDSSKGYGLGLHIVKKLSEDCNISFKIQSEPNKGTTYYFDISVIMNT